MNYKYSLDNPDDLIKAFSFAEIIKSKLTAGKKEFGFNFGEHGFKEFITYLDPNTDNSIFIEYDEIFICTLPSSDFKNLYELVEHIEEFLGYNIRDIYFSNFDGWSVKVMYKTFNEQKTTLNRIWYNMERILKLIKTSKSREKDKYKSEIETERKRALMKLLAKEFNCEIVENDKNK